MLVNRRLRELRQLLELSQEAIGAQGFISTSGWVKIENGQRQPSDDLLEKLVRWLERDRYITKANGVLLMEELMALKYMGDSSPFIRRLAKEFYEKLISSPRALIGSDHPRLPKAKKVRS
jgi:transcriptional regulator with XRE-family HTH domain